MRSVLRTLSLCLVGGLLGGVGFFGATAVASHQFSDVATGNAFHDDIDWLTANGIASGYPDGTFRPANPINRQQASRWFRNFNDQIQIAIDNVDPPAGTEFTATVDCPAGMRAVSGSGAVGPDADLALADSYPSETFQGTVRWESDNDAVINPTTVQAIALCVPGL